MIDDYTPDHMGWARFSDDRRLRYRLARALTENGRRAIKHMRRDGIADHLWLAIDGVTVSNEPDRVRRVVFVMLNPSTADAFKLDPTVSKCVKFAQRWGADVLEVVNLFALRSTDPKGLDGFGDIGDGVDNDREITCACMGAHRVIAAWGNHAWRRDRGAIVRNMLTAAGYELELLGMTDSGYPLHPLARGKTFIPLTRAPEVWR